jgi:hypothetical protein
MLKMDETTEKQVAAVRKKCEELDKEHEGIDLVKKLEKALDYAAKFGDGDLEGKSENHLSPLDGTLRDGDELTISHFNFWVSAQRPGGSQPWFGMAMHYHNGGQGNPWDSVELCPERGPHWSFHS